MLIFDTNRTCIAKPLFEGSRLFEFSCGNAAFVEGDTPRECPFCRKPVNSLVEQLLDTGEVS